MKIAILAAGAGGTYCGSCMRDNTLAATLLRRGHKVTLIPLYSPLRTDTPNVEIDQVFYGGVNVYLQHATRLFRKTPRLVDWLLDSKWLIAFAGRLGTNISPSHFGALTLDILRGEEGPAIKELRRLLDFLLKTVRPDVVSLPNLMFIGLARLFRRELGLPVVCELTGEDIFLDALSESYQSQAHAIIRERASDVSRFVAASSYYADRMSTYLGVPREQIDVAYSGLPSEYLQKIVPPPSRTSPLTVGYLARVCPEKGFERLVDAMLLLNRMPGMEQVRFHAAGYLRPMDRRWFANLRRRIAASPLGGQFHYAGVVDQVGKREFFQNIDVFSVPTVYEESKGIYVFESLAHAVPVVQPNHGAFPEILQRTGGGLLVRPGDAPALAAALADLLTDAPRRSSLGKSGRAAVFASFTDDAMAQNMVNIFAAAVSLSPVPRGEGQGEGPNNQ